MSCPPYSRFCPMLWSEYLSLCHKLQKYYSWRFEQTSAASTIKQVSPPKCVFFSYIFCQGQIKDMMEYEFSQCSASFPVKTFELFGSSMRWWHIKIIHCHFNTCPAVPERCFSRQGTHRLVFLNIKIFKNWAFKSQWVFFVCLFFNDCRA